MIYKRVSFNHNIDLVWLNFFLDVFRHILLTQFYLKFKISNMKNDAVQNCHSCKTDQMWHYTNVITRAKFRQCKTDAVQKRLFKQKWCYVKVICKADWTEANRAGFSFSGN